jgi:TonB family protein
LFERTRNGRAGTVLAVTLAFIAHAALANYTPDVTPRSPKTPPLEVQFVAAEPPPPPPPPPATAESPIAEPKLQAPAVAKPAAAPAAAPPPPAAAPAVLTAKEIEPAQASADMLDFTSDPNATQLSSGVVALGGKGTHGVRTASVTAPAVALPRAQGSGSGEALTQLGDLSRKPSLGVDDPCRGFFPPSALDNRAQASVLVVISKDGSVKRTSLVNESPAGQGFGAAAQACMKKQRFTPALDRQGQLAATQMRVNVRFNR